jgi:rRNA processing protein Gar1
MACVSEPKNMGKISWVMGRLNRSFLIIKHLKECETNKQMVKIEPKLSQKLVLACW